MKRSFPIKFPGLKEPAHINLFAEINTLWAEIENLNKWMMIITSILSTLFLGGFGAFAYANQTNIKKRMVELDENIINANTISDELSSGATELSQAAVQQQNAVTNCTQSLATIKSAAEKTNENAKACQDLAITSFKAAQNGEQGVKIAQSWIGKVQSSTDDIIQQAQENSKNFKKIIDVLHEIKSDTEIINDIAFQTKILSFNASVEAARAGEHGKGFSVVAEEVGNLANMSSNAAHEISGKVESRIKHIDKVIQGADHSINVIVSESKTMIDKTNEITEQNGKSLTEIVNLVKEVENRTIEIVDASEGQVTSLNDVVSSVELLEETASKLNEQAEEGQARADQFVVQSRQLSQVHFGLKNYFLDWQKSSTIHNNQLATFHHATEAYEDEHEGGYQDHEIAS